MSAAGRAVFTGSEEPGQAGILTVNGRQQVVQQFIEGSSDSGRGVPRTLVFLCDGRVYKASLLPESASGFSVVDRDLINQLKTDVLRRTITVRLYLAWKEGRQSLVGNGVTYQVMRMGYYPGDSLECVQGEIVEDDQASSELKTARTLAVYRQVLASYRELLELDRGAFLPLDFSLGNVVIDRSSGSNNPNDWGYHPIDCGDRIDWRNRIIGHEQIHTQADRFTESVLHGKSQSSNRAWINQRFFFAYHYYLVDQLRCCGERGYAIADRLGDAFCPDLMSGEHTPESTRKLFNFYDGVLAELQTLPGLSLRQAEDVVEVGSASDHVWAKIQVFKRAARRLNARLEGHQHLGGMHARVQQFIDSVPDEPGGVAQMTTLMVRGTGLFHSLNTDERLKDHSRSYAALDEVGRQAIKDAKGLVLGLLILFMLWLEDRLKFRTVKEHIVRAVVKGCIYAQAEAKRVLGKSADKKSPRVSSVLQPAIGIDGRLVKVRTCSQGTH